MLATYVRVTNLLDRLRADERGVTAVEYAVMAAAVAGLVATAAFALGGKVNGIFNGITLTAPVAGP